MMNMQEEILQTNPSIQILPGFQNIDPLRIPPYPPHAHEGEVYKRNDKTFNYLYYIEKVIPVQKGDSMSCQCQDSLITRLIKNPSKKALQFWKPDEIEQKICPTKFKCKTTGSQEKIQDINFGCFKTCFEPKDFKGDTLQRGGFKDHGDAQRVFTATDDGRCYSVKRIVLDKKTNTQQMVSKEFLCFMKPFL